MLANMNQSERLHNQGYKEQVITPELKLSMELRATCERLLQEKGQTVIDVDELALYFFPVVGPLPGVMKSIRNKIINPVDNIRHKDLRVKIGYPNLRSSRSGEFIHIKCPGVSPTNSKFIDVIGLEEHRDTWLRLHSSRSATIMGYKPNKGIVGTFGVRPVEVRPAFSRELEYYKHQIYQSSPVEHK